MKDGIKLKGKLATYMRWPFILAILLVAMDVLLYSVSWKAGGIGTVFTAVYLLLGILLYFQKTGAPQRTDFFCYPIWSGAEKSDEKLCTSLCLAGCRRKDPLDE